MRTRNVLLLLALPLVALGIVVLLSAGGDGSPQAQTKGERTAERFLDRYMEADGRVVRRDEGGDTVSEGQAYAMLLAVAIGDQERFQLAWTWARDNLRRPDGLLSYLWRDGSVADRQAATDADLDAAHALVLAGERFGVAAYRKAGEQLGRAVLEHETADVGGRLVLLAGPWARSPTIVNPSYFALQAMRALEGVSNDPRWAELRRSSLRLTDELTRREPPLPPDWATVRGSQATPVPAPSDPDGPPRYGLDAARVPVRFASACGPAARRQAASLGPFLRGEARGGGEIALAYGLDGRPLEEARHPLAVVAAAATAHAADDPAARDSLLRHAEELEERFPTYYGAAWVALGRVMLTTDALGGC